MDNIYLYQVFNRYMEVLTAFVYKWTIFSYFSVFYLSFIVTPLCSNASELMSSLIFASKKKKNTSSLTFSQVS